MVDIPDRYSPSGPLVQPGLIPAGSLIAVVKQFEAGDVIITAGAGPTPVASLGVALTLKQEGTVVVGVELSGSSAAPGGSVAAVSVNFDGAPVPGDSPRGIGPLAVVDEAAHLTYQTIVVVPGDNLPHTIDVLVSAVTADFQIRAASVPGVEGASILAEVYAVPV